MTGLQALPLPTVIEYDDTVAFLWKSLTNLNVLPILNYDVSNGSDIGEGSDMLW